MKTVLAKVHAGGQLLPEESFGDGVIRLGRDQGECQVTFDNVQYPMVSRRHAELRRQGEQWALHDLNSSFGTFLNGQRLTQPQVVTAGHEIRLGSDGPALRVIRLATGEVTTGHLSLGPPPSPPTIAPSPRTPAPAELPPITKQRGPSSAELEVVGDPFGSGPPVKVTKDSTWLGRDAGCDVVLGADAFMVSRKHAEVRREGDRYVVRDNGSFNGTLINEQRISTPTAVYHHDQVRLGLGGPVIRFNAPGLVRPDGAGAGPRPAHMVMPPNAPHRGGAPFGDAAAFGDARTLITKPETASVGPRGKSDDPQLVASLAFGDKRELVIGRGDGNDVRLDGLQISNRHARLVRTAYGVDVEDLNSTNGVYISGNRVSRRPVSPNDAVQIGAYVVRVDAMGNVGVFDTRSKVRIDSVNITKEVRDRTGGGVVRLLDGVSLTIMPNEFVGLLGPSGAGKSTFMDALNGMRPASGGSVLLNNLDLYQNLDALKQSIGYVPQDDIIHRELTVYRTLYYVAKLRLSGDVSGAEVRQIIDEVMDVTGLAERRDVPINQLSGGQRKRVSIAVELITKPSVIFLDEPTSGLDPATEEKIMRLFRQIAESGRTVILTTHAMENVKLFDKIVLLMRGKLVFYGRPDEAMAHVGAKSFKELYDRIEEPIEPRMRSSPGLSRHAATEQVAEEWKQRFTRTPQYRKNVAEPMSQIGNVPARPVKRERSLGLLGSTRQWLTLSQRYWEVLFRDRMNLFILLVQAPIIAVLTYLAVGVDQPRDFAYFVISLVAVWFGTSLSAREVVRERAVYSRERMVNLGLGPYVFSKIFVLGAVVGVQCLSLFIPLKLLDLTGIMPMPGNSMGVPQLAVMLLTAGVGIALGLLISALVKTSEMATSLVPLILIPQILFSGLIGVPSGLNKVVGLAMPATWSFDAMKRFSHLDTLEPDGSFPFGKFAGKGYYKWIEAENDRLIVDSRRKIDEFREREEEKKRQYELDLKHALAARRPDRAPDMPKSGAAPKLDDPRKVKSEEVRNLVTFLHPWMGTGANEVVLFAMFVGLVVATLTVLRKQDIG